MRGRFILFALIAISVTGCAAVDMPTNTQTNKVEAAYTHWTTYKGLSHRFVYSGSEVGDSQGITCVQIGETPSIEVSSTGKKGEAESRSIAPARFTMIGEKCDKFELKGLDLSGQVRAIPHRDRHYLTGLTHLWKKCEFGQFEQSKDPNRKVGVYLVPEALDPNGYMVIEMNKKEGVVYTSYYELVKRSDFGVVSIDRNNDQCTVSLNGF